jgi:hypothetical protein
MASSVQDDGDFEVTYSTTIGGLFPGTGTFGSIGGDKYNQSCQRQ